MRICFLILTLVLVPFLSNAKRIVQFRDSITGEILPYASVMSLENKKRSYVADEEGMLLLPDYLKQYDLVTSYTGYTNKVFSLGESDTLVIVRMSPTEYDLEEVYVKPKKEKYSKKNNPAVDFVNKLRKASKQYNPANEPYYSYDKYEKTLLAINNFKGQFDSGFLSKKTKFLEHYVDTSNYTGARLLNLILKEKAATKLMSKNPKANKEVILAYKSNGVDEIFDQENMRVLLEEVIKEIDVYEPDINILHNRFVSPLAPIGPDFYRYYLSDTVFIGTEKCIELSFVPRNPQSMGFNGKIYVSMDDSTMFVKKITMRTPKDINLNYLQNLYVNQSFFKDSIGNRHKTYDDIVVEMKILPATPELYGRKTSVYDNFSYQPREDLKHLYHKLGDEISLVDSVDSTPQFWDLKRMVPMTYAESRMGDLTLEMRKVPLLYWGEKVVKLLENGYIGTGKPSKFDVGPLNTLISFSASQGWRIKLGGMTTAALNPHIFLKGYVAYATKSHRWKYGGTIEYSFTKKKRHANEWPKNGIYASYSDDNFYIGETYLFTNQDNFFLSWKRKSNHLYTTRKKAQGGYVLELRNNFSFEAGLKYQQQFPTPHVPFLTTDGRHLSYYRHSAFNISLRWAKGEKFLQNTKERYIINSDPWVIQLTHQFSPKGFLGTPFTTNITELAVQKRFWFSAFGYLDMIVKGGKVWSAVYFPALLWPNANLSYTIQPVSYSLMNPMEFANDTYGALDLTYFGNGILFNHIPGIKKLKLREAVTFKGLMGSLSKRNNPVYNKSILNFPLDAHSTQMKDIPYMEIGVGIDNILTVLRVDYVWRLTYRNTPGIDKSGIRISLHFNL